MYLFACIKEHSQRVPNKNFRELDNSGTQLYQRFIKEFHNDKYPLYIDTDSNKIIDYCNKNTTLTNVCCYKRKKELCGDKVSTDLLIENCINSFELPDNKYMAHIFVTAPFFKFNSLIEAYENIKNHNSDSIFSAEIIKKRLWKRTGHWIKALRPLNHNPKKLEQTQDLPDIYIENSIFYIFKIGSFKKFKYRLCGTSMGHVLPFPENIDIDTEKDWEVCKKLMKGYIVC